MTGERISLLLPTRQRPVQLTRLMRSVMEAAANPALVEFVTYMDDDDPSYDRMIEFGPDHVDLDVNWTVVRGPREVGGIVGNLSFMWNECYNACKGDIVMHCGDDIVMRTKGWDDVVREAFDAVPDKILFAFGKDGIQDANNFGTHGFIHRRWVETVGYLFPPFFSSDYNDVFLNDVAKFIGRHREIPIYNEHLHYCAGKADIDTNTAERLARHLRDRPDLLYDSPQVQEMIQEAAGKLRGVIQGS